MHLEGRRQKQIVRDVKPYSDLNETNEEEAMSDALMTIWETLEISALTRKIILGDSLGGFTRGCNNLMQITEVICAKVKMYAEHTYILPHRTEVLLSPMPDLF